MPKSNKIYMDYAASVSPNPSSIHALGIRARDSLESARRQVADVLGARPAEIIFTSGGTEGNNIAIQGVIHLTPSPLSLPRRGVGERSKNSALFPHIVTTNIEHPSVLETCRMLERRGLAEISIVPVEANGIVNPKKIKKEIKENTVLVSVMYANNEIGTIQPIREIAREIRHYRKMHVSIYPFFHTDAVQAVNYLDLGVEKLGVDMLTLSGAKIPGAGRVGVLYKKKSVPLANIWGGGDQEGGLRPGTENLPEILKFSAALAFTQKTKEKEAKRLGKLRDYFIRQLIVSSKNNFFGSSEKIPRPLKNHSLTTLILNGDLENRLPNNVNITFPKIPSDLLVIELSAKGIMASSKSACKSSRAEGSYVIKTLRPEADPEIGGLRFSMGKDTKKEDIDYIIKTLTQILQKLKKWYN